MSCREPTTTINGERVTWAAALEAEGLPYDHRLATVAHDYHDLRKMTRERAAKREALPRYDGPPPETIAEGDALIKEIGQTYSGLSDEATAAIMHLRGEADRLAAAETVEDQVAGIPEAEPATPTRTDPREVLIPDQLRRPDIRFILVPPAKKGAMEKRWESDANYSHDHTTLALHLKRGGNFGLFPAPGSPVVMIDADEFARIVELGALDELPDTFIVESGSSTPQRRKAHLFYVIDGEPLEGKRVFLDPETGDHLGEVYAQHPTSAKGYVIGAGSLHPSGERYRVTADRPIARVPRAAWDTFAAAVRWEKVKPAPTIGGPKTSPAPYGANLAEQLGLTVTDFLMPVKAHERDGEYEGEHPVHGSDTGSNLTATAEQFWCRRHQSGGGPLEAFAVAEGIIDCADAGPGCLKAVWHQVVDRLREKGYDVAGAEQKRRAARRRTYTPAEREAAGTAEAVEGPKPAIQINDRQLREMTADALTAMVKANQPPRVFVRTGVLTRIGCDEDGRPSVQPMGENQVRYELARSADFRKVTAGPARDEFGRIERDEQGKVKLEVRITSVPPPIEVVRDLMANPSISTIFPPLRAIIEAPSLRADGGLIITPGYDEASGYYLAPSPGLEVPEILDDPTPEQATAAAGLVKEAICDFPYVGDADRANAIAALLTPVLRPFIAGPIPLGLLDKPQQGTGASLLAEGITIIATGTNAGMSDPPKREEEWGKSILSDLLAGRAVIVYDNVEGRLRAPALASALTAEYVQGRVLGRLESVRVPQRAVWLVTGINIQLAGDLPRRCFWVRMNAKDPHPWLRDGFTHPNLKEWLRAERGRIIAAVLTLARAWVRAGRPVDGALPVLGSFEAWSTTIGGILSYAGIDGFLGNLDQQYEEADADGPAWAAFLEAWHELWGSNPKTVAEMVKQIQTDAAAAHPENTLYGVLPPELLDAFSNREKFNRRMGDAFRRRKDTYFENGFRLEAAGAVNRAVQWRVVKG